MKDANFVVAGKEEEGVLELALGGWDDDDDVDEGEDHVTREVVVSIQGLTRAPLRLRQLVHWHVWVFQCFYMCQWRFFFSITGRYGPGAGLRLL